MSELPKEKQHIFRKILLISLPVIIAPKDTYLENGHSFHLGLAYLASVLRLNSYEVRILDCYVEDRYHSRSTEDLNWLELGLSDEEIIKHISEFDTDLIGITIPFSCQHYVAHHIARLIKSYFHNIVIVAGGNHVTAVPAKIDTSCFDYLIIGEGEYIFLQLLDSLNTGNFDQNIPGIYGSSESEPQFIDNLDALPFPAIDLLPLQKIWASGRRWINMVATRGCVYDCNFCSVHTVMGYKIRRRSVDNVIVEINHWKSMFNIQEVYFEDDNLTTNSNWAKNLFEEIAKCKLGIRFYARNGIRADTIDKDLLNLMKAAGFQDFMIAPESGSQKTLDEIIGKKMRLEDCENAIKLAREVGLGVNLFFVIGFPEESWEDIENTINYAKKLKKIGCAGFWISTATPYPGTRLYRQCVQQGLIDPDNLDFRKMRTVDYALNTEHFKTDELKAFREAAMHDLAPPHYSLLQKTKRGFTIFVKDPLFFYTKLRYKLNRYL